MMDSTIPQGLASSSLTFANSGGGFFPRQRFDRAQTAFRVIVNRVDLVRSLKETAKINLEQGKQGKFSQTLRL